MKKDEKAAKAPKKTKTKKQKPPKEKKAKKTKNTSAEQETSEKKKGIPKILLIVLPVVLLLAVAGAVVFFLFFRTPSEEEQVKKIAANPDAYIMGADEVVSLESVVEEGMVKRTSVETPMEDGPQEWTYHYREVNDTPSKLAASYAEILRGEENGFIVIDMDHHEVEEEPDMESAIGSVIMAKPSVDIGNEGGDGKKDGDGDGEDGSEGGGTVDKLLQVILAWSENSMAIRVSQPEGTILPPVVIEEPDPAQREPVALQAQLEYFNLLEPEKLGLPGDFMSEYRVYPVDGFVRVSGVTCRVLNVYVLDMPAETNTFMGTFYLSSDNSELFKLDESGVIVPVKLD